MIDDRFALHDILNAGNEVLARRDNAALYHVFEHTRGQGGEPRRTLCDRAERNARFFGGLLHIVRLFALPVRSGGFVAFALRIFDVRARGLRNDVIRPVLRGRCCVAGRVLFGIVGRGVLPAVVLLRGVLYVGTVFGCAARAATVRVSARSAAGIVVRSVVLVALVARRVNGCGKAFAYGRVVLAVCSPSLWRTRRLSRTGAARCRP